MDNERAMTLKAKSERGGDAGCGGHTWIEIGEVMYGEEM